MNRPIFGFAAFLALALLAFGGFLPNPFVFDDILLIRENSWLVWAAIPRFFRSFIFEPTLGFNGYRPLPMAFFAILRELFGESPIPFRSFSLAIHLINGILFYQISKSLFPRASLWGLVAMTAIFLVHPLQSNLIALAWNLPDLLFVTGSLFSLLFFCNSPCHNQFSSCVLTFYFVNIFTFFKYSISFLYMFLISVIS